MESPIRTPIKKKKRGIVFNALNTEYEVVKRVAS